MQRQYKIIFLPMILSLGLSLTATLDLQAQAEKVRVDVFIASESSIEFQQSDDFDITYHALDGIERFEAMLSSNLSVEPSVAKSQVQARFKAVKAAQAKRLQATAESLALAQQYGIDKHPAVVIDGKWVVYGVSNVSRAIRIYQDWRNRSAG